MKTLIDRLADGETLSRDEFKALLSGDEPYLYEQARQARRQVYGDKIFMRGLIELSSCCKNDCFYCGLRRSNAFAQRYRLSKEQILNCCDNGYGLGFRTFVLQGGEDAYFTDERLSEIVSEIRRRYPDCAITLSVGERSYESYLRLYEAGANRYLLRHETASADHYRMLHPGDLSLESRKKCLWDLKKIGYQVGCGFMVGSPGQTLGHIVEDFLFIKTLEPAMVGVGPFLPHSRTPFANEKPGDLRLTLNIIAVLRLIRPNLLLPATTALGTLCENGREMGVMAGANVVMPNLSPSDVREKYTLYDNKISTGCEAAENVADLKKRMEAAGCELVASRGDFIEI